MQAIWDGRDMEGEALARYHAGNRGWKVWMLINGLLAEEKLLVLLPC